MIDAVFAIVGPLSFAAAVGALAARRAPTPSVRRLLWAGLALRLVGGLFYLAVHETAYGGGDYSLYTLQAFAALEDPGTGVVYPVLDAYGGYFNGTAATSLVAWGVALVIGRSTVGLFLVFSAVNFAGAAFFGAAFERAYPDLDPTSFYRWVMLFPSLWFWPSPLGKDALILAGLGLSTLGFVGRSRRQWAWVLSGLAAVFLIRVSYVVIAAAAFAAGGLVGRNRKGTELQWIVTFVVVALGTYAALPLVIESVGFTITDLSTTIDQIDQRADASSYGGSAFEPARNPISAIVTALFRPFPWEASGILMLASSAEVLLLCGLVVRRRRAVSAFLRRHWRSEFAVVSLAFTLALALLVGLAVANFGTLVRQRVVLYPFLFVVLAGYPYRARVLSPLGSAALRRRRSVAAAGR